jgi:chromosome segregation ATPase
MIPVLFTLVMLLVADLPEHLEQDIHTFHAQIATLNAKLEALQEATLQADANARRQGERLYELIRDNERLQSEKMMALKERQDRAEGKSSGISQGWGVLLGLLSTGVAIAALMSARRRAAG